MTSNPAAASGPTFRAQIRRVSGQPWTSRSGRPPTPARSRRSVRPGRTSTDSPTGPEANLVGPMADRYDPATLEPRWQRVWADERTWEVSNEDVDPARKSYVLEMLPYP